MREMILNKIKQFIDDGDDEITINYGDFEKIKAMSDEDLLNVFEFTVGFRG